MRTEKSPPRIACKTCNRSYPNEVAPLLLLVEPCSRSVSREPVAGDSIVSLIHCIVVPSGNDQSAAPGRKNAGDQIETSCTALVFSRIFEQARRAASSHPNQNPANPGKFRSIRRIFAIRVHDLAFRSRMWAALRAARVETERMRDGYPTDRILVRLADDLSHKRPRVDGQSTLLVVSFVTQQPWSTERPAERLRAARLKFPFSPRVSRLLPASGWSSKAP